MIEVKGLTKRYGNIVAVNNIDLTVNEGEIVGFLGPNGAGKTTTMNIITGFLSATEGSCSVCGIDILDEPEKAKKEIGYLPDNPPLYGDMLVGEYLDFVCDLKGVTKNKQQMIKEVTELVKVSEMKNRLVRNLSKGYRQRVGLAQALIGWPKVIIMDEPTVGLDPKQIIEMRDVIRKLSKKHTVLLSSHILSEVSAICDRVVIINKGSIVASDTPEKLSSSLTHGRKLAVRIKGDKQRIMACCEGSSLIREVNQIISREPGTYDAELSGDEGVDIREAVFKTFAAANLPILMMKPLDLTLEEIFLQVTTGTNEVLAEGGAR